MSLDFWKGMKMQVEERIAYEREVFASIRAHVSAAVALAEELWEGSYPADFVSGLAQHMHGGAQTVPTKLPVDVPTKVRWAVWIRDDFTCQHCGTRANLTIDHIVPRIKDGPATMANLQTLCSGCNARKGAR